MNGVVKIEKLASRPLSQQRLQQAHSPGASPISERSPGAPKIPAELGKSTGVFEALLPRMTASHYLRIKPDSLRFQGRSCRTGMGTQPVHPGKTDGRGKVTFYARETHSGQLAEGRQRIFDFDGLGVRNQTRRPEVVTVSFADHWRAN
jgi:hypothetical protein